MTLGSSTSAVVSGKIYCEMESDAEHNDALHSVRTENKSGAVGRLRECAGREDVTAVDHINTSARYGLRSFTTASNPRESEGREDTDPSSLRALASFRCASRNGVLVVLCGVYAHEATHPKG
jgi:hypothetical protein